MAKFLNKNGKKINTKFLPQFFCGERIPVEFGEALLKGNADTKSMWSTYSIEEIAKEKEATFIFDGDYLTRIN